MICFLVNFFISILYFIFFCFSSYLLVLMEEHSIEDRFASIEAKLELLLHKLDQRIHNDSLMEQGVLPYQGSSNPTFQEEEELFLAKELNFTYMDENKKMSSLHELKFPDLDTFQVNTSARLKKIEGQIGHLFQAFKNQFSRTSPSNTLKNPIECMDAHLSNVQKFHILKYVEEGKNELEIENKALLNNLDDEESLLDKLKFEEVSQVMAIENILVKIDTFTFPMDLVTWGIEGDLQNSHILRRPLLSSSQAWIDINKGELTLLLGEEKAKFNLHQPLPLMEQERATCRKFCSLLQSKGHMFEQSPLSINVFTSTLHRGDCFEEIVAEPPAIIKEDFEFISPIQNLKENILELNGYEKEVLSKMNDWSNGSTSTFPMSLAGL